MAEKRHFQVMIFGLFQAPEVPPASATCCFRRRNKMLPMLSRRAAACLHTASATCLCCVLLPCILRPLGSVSKLTSCASSCRRSSGCSRYVLRRRRRIYFCMLRSSMLSTAAERRLMVTPICCLESRKCSFLLHLLLLFLWSHKQKCSAPRDMSIGTLTLLYLGRPLGVHWTPPKM